MKTTTSALRATTCLLAALLALSLRSAAADDDPGLEALAQELFIGETPFVQEAGETQIGITGRYFDFGSSHWESELVAEFEYGLTDRLTIGLEVPYVAFGGDDLDEESGPGDAELGLLYALVHEQDWLLTLGVAANLRTGDEDNGLGEEDFEWEPSLGYARKFGDSQLTVAVGAELSGGETSPFATAAWAGPLGGAIGIVELYGRFPDEEDANDEESEGSGPEEDGDIGYLTFGMLWAVEDDMQVQIGVPIGLTDDAADWAVVVGWNVEFE